jgi:hypothetical protein
MKQWIDELACLSFCLSVKTPTNLPSIRNDRGFVNGDGSCYLCCTVLVLVFVLRSTLGFVHTQANKGELVSREREPIAGMPIWEGRFWRREEEAAMACCACRICMIG